MASYTLSNCILININAGKKYITDLLMVFTQESNPFKVSLDKSNRIMNLYEEAGLVNEHVANWLALMSYQPTNFETINVDTTSIQNNEEVFLKVCSQTKSQRKLIVYSHEGWEYHTYEGENTIIYDFKTINVLDRDEAIQELMPSKITAINSIVATDQASITKSKNE